MIKKLFILIIGIILFFSGCEKENGSSSHSSSGKILVTKDIYLGMSYGKESPYIIYLDYFNTYYFRAFATNGTRTAYSDNYIIDLWSLVISL